MEDGGYDCPDCKAWVATEEKLEKHQEKVHGDAYEAPTPRGDSWENARDEWPTRDELLEELEIAFTALGRAPTVREMRQFGEYHSHEYEREFGTWNNALKAAKLPINAPNTACRRLDDGELLEAVRELADELGKVPSTAELRDELEYSFRSYRHRWDTPTGVLVAAGLLEPAT